MARLPQRYPRRNPENIKRVLHNIDVEPVKKRPVVKKGKKKTVAASAKGKQKKPSRKLTFRSKYNDLIVVAIEALASVKGSSRIAIRNYLIAHYPGLSGRANYEAQIKMAISRGIATGTIKHFSQFSFKLAQKVKARKAVKAASKKPTKKPAKKPTKKVAKKPASPKKEKAGKKKVAVKKRKSPEKSARKPKQNPPKKRAKQVKFSDQDAAKEAEIPVVENVEILTQAVAFNTTDLPDIRDDLNSTMKKLLRDDNIRVGIIANRGVTDDGGYKLERLDFTDDGKQLDDFVENSYGEGANWLEYYKLVLEDAVNLSWGQHRTKNLILIGDANNDALVDPSLQNIVGRLNQIGVRTYGMHHSQLEILQDILGDLN